MFQQERINHFRSLYVLRRFNQGFIFIQLVSTSPSIDFSCDYLLSFCIYYLLKTQQLPATPR
jgi:hypothetical protein